MKNKIKKISIWLLCILLLSFVSLLPSTLRAKADGNKVSAYDQLIASAMSQCMDQLYATATDDFNNQWNPFAILDFASVTVGYDLHNKLYGNTDSGSVSCKDFNVNTFKSNIIEAFATSINPNYSTENIVCNGENPGLMKLQWKDSNGNWKDMSGACASYIDEADGFSYRFVLNDRTAADSYIDSLYAGDWKSVNNFSDEAKYALYLDEYVAACTTGKSVTSDSPDKSVTESSSQVNLSGYGDYILKINTNGNAEYIYYEQGNKATAWIDKSLSGGIAGASDCEDLRNKINEKGSILHEEYENQLVAQIEADKEMCTRKASAALTAAKQLAKDGYEGYDKTVAELEAMNGEYWTMEGNVVHCKTWNVPDKLVQIETETEKNDPNNPGNISSGADDSSSNLDTVAVDDDISACKKATSLGWILCPTMNLLGKAAMGLYGELSETWLTINDTEVEASDGNALYSAWKEFRDYANIGFAILFAIVVLSQVTGIGLSNYSIKKMLPTLIMVAVLVNVSFFICQLAIDVTNIFGVAVGDALSSIGKDALGESGGRTVGGTAAYITSGLLQAAGIGAAGAATFVLGGFASIGSILVPVIGILISAFISYFFLLILMALRKAVLYIVIIVSPLAFICYALPNTKSLFDRWKKMFINLLFVFPVCQILVFGGQAMSKIMMSTDENSFFFQFTAMALQIVPIFFIPTVLKNAVATLGNIGAKLSAMGSRVGRGLSQAAMGTHLAKQTTLGLNKWGAEKSLAFKPGGKLGKALSLRKTGKLRAGKALMAYQDFKLGDAKTEYAADHITDSTIQDDIDTQAYGLQQKAVSDVVSAIDRGGMKIGGSVINPNDDDSIFAGYEYARDQYLATDDDNWRIRALGLQEKLMRKGKPAQAMLTQSIMDLADNNRSGDSKVQNRIKKLAGGLMLDKNNVAAIKDSDPGAFYALNDIARSNNGFDKLNTDLDDYRTKGYEEFSAQSLRNAGKGFWDNWNDVATSYLGGVDKNGNAAAPTKSLANMSAAQRQNVTKMAEIVTAAMQNPRFAGQLDSKYSDKMNKVRELAHMVQGNRGTFKKINLNDVIAQEGKSYKVNNSGNGKKGRRKGKRR